MRIRKNARYLTDLEKNTFVRAVLTLKAQTMPGISPAMSRYDYFVLMHFAATRVVFSASTHNMAHSQAMFLPWHREYILRFENALRATIPGVTDDLTLPYWDWGWTPPEVAAGKLVEHDPVLNSNFLGGNGGAAIAGGVAVVPSGGSIQTGYFMYDAPSPLPAWWPPDLLGWRVPDRIGVPVIDDALSQALVRDLGSAFPLPTVASVDTSFTKTTYATFRQHLEGASHAAGHNWFSPGHMSNPARSPSDPMFFLHHANIDRLWALWQIHGLATDTYDAAAPAPYRLTDPMWPWGWAAASFTLNTWSMSLPVPDHSAEAARHPADVLDHHALGYRYDSEIVLGIALDRSSSMNGLTPDPMTGSPPDVTKWAAAKSGVENLLLDCAVAFASREAYVTAGVLLFGTGVGGNEIVPVWASPGVVKASGTYSAGGFTAALGAAAPAGGTPIATALAQAETTLVRAPYPTSPSDDPRYIAFLTDGLETSPPLLSTIANHAYANTRIFAMGFGIGSGWDGVSYTGIQDIVDKGASAIAGVNQVFHGENGGEIDKFFGDTLTRALDFSHVTDPLYELAAGEHTHTPFAVNAGDDAFLITVQGFDYDDARWMVDLIGPDGTTYGGTTAAPVRLDVLRRRGRTSMMLKRSGASDVQWIGNWQVRTMRTHGHDHGGAPHDHLAGEMFMPDLWDLLRHPGAPRPTGKLYAAAGIHRLPERFTPSAAALTRLRLKLADVRLPPGPTDVCAVSVNVNHRGRVRTTLAIPARPITAGHPIDLRVLVSGVELRDLDDVVITGRVIAPGFSIGNLLADHRTVPIAKRAIDRASGQIDLHRFLVDVEAAMPQALPIRDQEVKFARDADGTLRARIATSHPGIHYLSVYLDATDTRSPRRERIRRVLATEVAVGLALDPRRSAPKVTHDGGKLRVTFTPVDHLGNIAAPPRTKRAQVVLDGIPVDATPVATLTEQHVLEVPLHKGEDHGVDAVMCLCCPDGTMMSFDPSREVRADVFWGGTLVAGGPVRATPEKPGSSTPVTPHDPDHHH